MAKAEKLYNFIVGEQPKVVTKFITKPNGMANTNDMRDNLNLISNLGENEYILSVTQLYLILPNINKVNQTWTEAGEGKSKKK